MQNHCFPLQETIRGDITIRGSITHAQYNRYNRNQIFTFVNNRWIKNNTIARAILKGYKNILPPKKFPAAFVFIELPQDKIDVNIHPKKEEIRFLQPRLIEQQIEKVVAMALADFVTQHIAPATQIRAPEARPFNAEAFAPKQTAVFQEPKPLGAVSQSAMPQAAPFNAQPIVQTVQQQKVQPIFEKQETVVSEVAILGQYHKTYILIEKEGSLVLVDQHAAHERIMYESLIKNFDNIETITLLFPHIVQLSDEQIALLEPHYSALQEHGLALETFSKSEIIIQRTPVYLKTHMLTAFIKDIIDWIVAEKRIDPDKLHHHLRATIACRSSYQAGDILNQEQMQNLIKSLQKTKNNNSCPHGRPTLWVLSKKEIDKQFKRDYQSQKINSFDLL